MHRLMILLATLLLATVVWPSCDDQLQVVGPSGYKFDYCLTGQEWVMIYTTPTGATNKLSTKTRVDGKLTVEVEQSLGWDDSSLQLAVADFEAGGYEAWTHYCVSHAIIDETLCMCSMSFGECTRCVAEWGQHHDEMSTALLAGSQTAMTRIICRQRFDDGWIPRQPECSDGDDNDGDLLIDMADTGCADPDDDNEKEDDGTPVYECDDGCLDNDGDGEADDVSVQCGNFDTNCSGKTDNDESR